MKRLLTISLLLISIFSFATGVNYIASTAEESIPDSSKVTMSKVYNDVKAGMTGLGSALKVGAEHVYIVLVKQQIVKACTYSLVGIIGLVFAIIFSMQLTKAQWKSDSSYYNVPDEELFNRHATLSIISGAIAFIFLLVFILHVDEIMMGFINPEYGAIKDIIDFVK